MQEVEPVIRGIIRRKLRVTLDPADGQRENQNGLELCGDVWVKLLQEAGTGAIRNLRSYAAVIAYHACSEYFREKYPARSSLRNRVHYFLTHHPEYAVWQSEDGDLVGGFLFWRDRKIEPAAVEKLSDLAPGTSAKPVERMARKDWDALFDSVFETLAAPAELDALVNAIAPLVGSVDAVEAGKIDVFPHNGIASIGEIGRSLAISKDQFELLFNELALKGDPHTTKSSLCYGIDCR